MLLGVHDSEVVDCHNESVPLSKVYNHHWIFNMDNTEHTNRACPDAGIDFIVGVGAESRRTPTAYPDGHGFMVEDGTTWNANIHLLQTSQLVGGVAGAKRCIECWWGPEKSCEPNANGTFGCCYSDSHCETIPGANDTKEVYFLKYTVDYTRDMDLLTPIDISILMAPQCYVQYNALPPGAPNSQQGYPSAAPPGPEHLVEQKFPIPGDIDLILAIGHLHTGAINATLLLNGHFLCASLPVYGTEPDVAGNELGHLVQITQCVGPNATAPGVSGPVALKKGDELTLQGWYDVSSSDSRIAPTPAGPHLVVMSYMITAFKESHADSN